MPVHRTQRPRIRRTAPSHSCSPVQCGPIRRARSGFSRAGQDGELLKLGYRVSATSIRKLLRQVSNSKEAVAIHSQGKMANWLPLVDALRTMLLTSPPEVRETIVDLRLGGRPEFPFPGSARDGPGGLGFDSPPEDPGLQRSNH